MLRKRISNTAGKDISGSKSYWPGVNIAEELRSLAIATRSKLPLDVNHVGVKNAAVIVKLKWCFVPFALGALCKVAFGCLV